MLFKGQYLATKNSYCISKAEYIRDIYMNGLSVDDFPSLDNLKSINVWT